MIINEKRRRERKKAYEKTHMIKGVGVARQTQKNASQF